MRIKILPLATSQIAHLCNQLNHVSTANIQCHVLKSISDHYSPKIKLFLQKNAKISNAWVTALEPPCLLRQGALPPDPLALAAGGLCPQTPKTAPPLRISGYAPALSSCVLMRESYPQVSELPFQILSELPFQISDICNNIPLQERLFSSCTCQKRKYEIKGKLKTNP